MKVRWDIEVDETDRLESGKAGKVQYVTVISTTLGPFDTHVDAEDAAFAIKDVLPKSFPQQGGKK